MSIEARQQGITHNSLLVLNFTYLYKTILTMPPPLKQLPPETFKVIKAFNQLRPNNTSKNISKQVGISEVRVNKILDVWFSGKDMVINSQINEN